MLVLFFILIFLSRLDSTGGVCAFKCSGHGACIGGFCECRRGYQGAICSERTCPVANAWIAKPFELMEDPVTYASYALRPQIECSNQGLCDRNTGVCRCFSGFTGAACQRTTCGASKCSGHGECVISRYFYEEMFPTSPRAYYNNWESNQTTACLCHTGYFGPDCSYRLCPKGVNPFVPYNQYPTIRISIYDETRKHIKPNGPSFIFRFQGKSFFFYHRLWKMADCKRQFEALPNVGTVNCSLESNPTDFLKTILVKFERFPVLPVENNVYFNHGDPSDWKMTCLDTRGPTARGTSCAIEVVNSSVSSVVYPTYEFCSGRGLCNFNSGTCNCFTGSYGAACDRVKYPLKPPPVVLLEDILLLNASKQSFNGSDLYLSTMYYADDTFNALLLSKGSENLTQITGGGSLILNNGSLSLRGLNHTEFTGQTIYAGGLHVVTAGVSVESGGLEVSNGEVTVGGPVSLAGGLTARKDVEISGPLVIPAGLTVLSIGLRVDNDGVSTKAGGMTIAAGGVILNDGVSVAAGGLMVLRRGITISDSGLVINSGGLAMRGPFNTFTIPPGGGITIGSGGIAVTGGLTVADVGLAVARGGLTVVTGGLRVTAGVTVHSSGLGLPSGLTVQDVGLVLPSSLTLSDTLQLSDRGFTVTTGGLSVGSLGVYATAGLTLLGNTGLSTPGGLTVNDVGLRVETVGATIASGGLVVEGSLTVGNGMVSRATGTNQRVLSGGVQIVAGGATVRSGGLAVTGGLSVEDPGAIINQGVKVNDMNVYIARGLSVGSGGMVVSNGLTVEFGGAAVTAGGVRVRGGGVALTGSLSVTGGLIVTGTVSLIANGLHITTGGLTVSSGGLTSEAAVDVRNIGVVVREGGLSVTTAGWLQTAGSLSVSSNGAWLDSTSAVSVFKGMVVVAGGLSVASSDVAITGGAVSIASSGVAVSGGLTIDNTALLVQSGGFTISGNLLSASGVTVRSRGVVVGAGGAVVRGSGLQVTAGGLSVGSRGMTTPVMTVHTLGVIVTGGMTVLSPLGNNLLQGGITLLSGSISTDRGRFADSGVVVSSGLSVFTAGAVVTSGGVTVQTGGLAAPSATIAFGGLAVSNGLTLFSGGLRTSSMTVADVGLVVTSGLTVVDGGGSSPYLTVRRGGLFADRLEVTPGLLVTGGLTVADGMYVSGGVTVPWLGVTDGGVTVAADGVMVLIGDPVYVNDNGIRVDNGQNLTVFGGTRLSEAYTYTSPSDVRLKTHIRKIPDSLERLHQLHGFTYKTRDPLSENPDKPYFGVLAQEVQQAVPEAVASFSLSPLKESQLVDPRHLDETLLSTEEARSRSSYLSVDYLALLPVLVNAVVELIDRVDYQSQSETTTTTATNSTSSSLECSSSSAGGEAFGLLDSFLQDQTSDERQLRRRIDAISCDCLTREAAEAEDLERRLEELREELREVRRDWLEWFSASGIAS